MAVKKGILDIYSKEYKDISNKRAKQPDVKNDQCSNHRILAAKVLNQTRNYNGIVKIKQSKKSSPVKKVLVNDEESKSLIKKPNVNSALGVFLMHQT